MLAVLGFVSLSTADDPVKSELLFQETFDRSGAGTKLRDRLAKHDNVVIEESAGPDGSAALRVTYRAGDRGSTGISESLPLPRSAREVSLSYHVKFEKTFDFSRGGKLPGLGPERPVTGKNPIRPTGWSARPMWREEGLLTSYVYHQDQPGNHGDYTRSDGFRLERGRFLAITVVVRLNREAGARDGRVEVFVDGKLRVVHRDLQLHGMRDEIEGARIRTLLFTTFHGGSDASWAPRDADGKFRDVVAWFDDIEVRAGRVIRGPVR